MKILTSDTTSTICPRCKKDHLSGELGARYLRISEDREGLEAGVTRQREDTGELACRESILLVLEYSDNDAGASTRSKKERPDYTRMLKDARKSMFKWILAYTSKRVTRRPRENEDLIELAEQYGISYRYVKSPSFDLNTANGRAVARTLAAWDANESEEMAERVARAYEYRVKSGKFVGGNRRYGFELDGITQRERECDEIIRAAEGIVAGVSLRALARDLNERKIPTTEGKHWDSLAVRAMLLRERNAGLLVYHGEIVEGVEAPWLPIVPDGTDKPREFWEAVWAKLTDPSRRTSPGNKPKWLLSGLATCAHDRCVDEGKENVVRQGGSKPGRADSYPAYRCVERGHNRIHALKADEFITRQIVDFLASPDAKDLIDTSGHVDTAPISREIATTRARIDEAKELWQEGIFTKAEMTQRVRRMQEQLAPLEEQLVAASEIDPLAGIAGQSNAREIWDELDLGRRRAIVQRLMTITINPAKRGRLPSGEYFDPSRIAITWKTS